MSWEDRKICPECKASGGPDGVTNCATCRAGFWESAMHSGGSGATERQGIDVPVSSTGNPSVSEGGKCSSS